MPALGEQMAGNYFGSSKEPDLYQSELLLVERPTAGPGNLLLGLLGNQLSLGVHYSCACVLETC